MNSFLEACYNLPRTPFLTDIAKFISLFDDGFVNSTVLTLIAAILFWKKDKIFSFVLTGGALFGAIFEYSIKLLVAKERPAAKCGEALTSVKYSSMPSGHVVFYTIFFGLLTWYAYKYLKGWVRNLLILISVLMMLSIGWSRLYLGVHWRSDVIVGYFIGATVLIASIAVYNFLKEKKWQKK